MKEIINPDDPLWTIRRGAMATVSLSITYVRYVHGEAVIETTYRLPDGAQESDPTSRIFLGSGRCEVIKQLWDKLFDAVLVAREYQVEQVTIDYQPDNLAEWNQDFLVTVLIAAYELDVLVTGAFFPGGLVQPGYALNLSDDLERVLFDSDDGLGWDEDFMLLNWHNPEKE